MATQTELDPDEFFFDFIEDGSQMAKFTEDQAKITTGDFVIGAVNVGSFCAGRVFRSAPTGLYVDCTEDGVNWAVRGVIRGNFTAVTRWEYARAVTALATGNEFPSHLGIRLRDEATKVAWLNNLVSEKSACTTCTAPMVLSMTVKSISSTTVIDLDLNGKILVSSNINEHHDSRSYEDFELRCNRCNTSVPVDGNRIKIADD